MFSYLKHTNHYLSGLFLYNSIYHVSPQFPRLTFIELVQFSIGKFICIGADILDSSVFLNVLSQNGLDSDEVVRSVLAKQVNDPCSTVRKGVVDALCERAGRSFRNSHKFDRIVIPYELTAPEQAKLISVFPEFNLTFPSSTNGHPHAYSAASRLCETQLALHKLSYRDSRTVPPGYVAAVKDVGGNYCTHIDRSRTNIHSCCPILDARDSARHTSRIMRLRHMKVTGSKKEYLASLNDINIRALMCQRRGQECPITAPSVMFVHSSYDMTTTDVADSMDAADAYEGIIVTLFDPEILTQSSGVIPYQNCLWSKETINGTQAIRFSFRNDSSLEYTHNLASYMKLCTTMVLKSSRGNLYFGEIVDRRNGCLYIRVLRNLCPEVAAGVLSYNVWLGNSEKVTVKYYDYGTHTNACNVQQRLKIQYKPCRITVSKSLYDAALTHLIGVSTPKFSIQSVFDYVRSLNSRVIVNGVLSAVHVFRTKLHQLLDSSYIYCVFYMV